MQKTFDLMAPLALLLLGVGLGSSAWAGPVQAGTESEAAYGEPARQELAPHRELRLRRAQNARELLRDPEVRERLGLTQDQLDRLERGVYDFRQRRIELRAELQKQRLELRRLMREDNPDRAAVDDVVRRLSETRERLVREQIERRLDNRDILTPSQKEEIRAILREKRLENRQRWRNRKDARPPG